MTELVLRFFTWQAYTPGYLITHPRRNFALKPGFVGYTYDTEFRINADGIRDDEKKIPAKSEGEFRIAFFGDSLGFGQGVPIEKTFAKYVEAQLRLSPELRNKQIRVLNLAVPGYNFTMIYDYALEAFERFKPDMLIFEYAIQQQAVKTESAGGAQQVNQVAWVRAMKDRLRELYIYNYFSSRYYAFIRSIKENDGKQETQILGRSIEKISSYYDEAYPGWQDCKQKFKELAEFAKERRLPVLFALAADEGGLSSTKVWSGLVTKIQDVLRAEGIRHVILLDEAFYKYLGDDRKLWLRENDGHYSEFAHQVAGEFLYNYLRENKGEFFAGF